MITNMDEKKLINNIDLQAERYFKKYKPFVEQLERHSLLRKFKKITSFDVWALGQMLENVDEMISMCEANGSVADLGLIPRIAKDVVTISYGTSPIPVIASVQPLDEEVGLVYYKKVTAVTGGGNVAVGDTLASAKGTWKTPIGYSSAETIEQIGTGNGTLTNFTGTLTRKPIRPGTVTVSAGSVTGTDFNQDGVILGDGVTGVINYDTGAISVTFSTAPGSGVAVKCTYWGNVEDLSSNVKEINYELDSTSVRAKIFVLKGVTGLFKAYSMQKRFGIAAEEELAVDLVNAINAEIFGSFVTKMDAQTPSGNAVTWTITLPDGVSYFEHKQSFKDALAGAERKILEAAKRGAISFIIAGSGVSSVIRTLFGWETVYEGQGMSCGHLFGLLDGIPVIRVSDTNVLGANNAIIGYKGPGAFEAPAVYAPYMPITVTSVLPTTSPVVTQRAAACWAGVEVLVPNFLAKVNISGNYPYS